MKIDWRIRADGIERASFSAFNAIRGATRPWLVMGFMLIC